MSLYTEIKAFTKQQITSLLYAENADDIDVIVMPVEQQTNSTGCGIYAIAFATALCHGDPSKLNLNRRIMQSHLWKCMESGSNIDMFPVKSTTEKSANSPMQIVNIKIYCECHQPYNPGEDMAQCSSCDKWYHSKCVNIPKKVFRFKKMKWQCNSCIQIKAK